MRKEGARKTSVEAKEKVSAWLSGAERKALYEVTEALGFPNYAELARTLAGLALKGKDVLGSLRDLLQGSHSAELRPLVVWLDANRLATLQLLAISEKRDLQANARSILEAASTSGLTQDIVASKLNSVDDSIQALRMQMEELSSRLATVESESEKRVIRIPVTLVSLTMQSGLEHSELADILGTILSSCVREQGSDGQLRAFVGSPKITDLKSLITILESVLDPEVLASDPLRTDKKNTGIHHALLYWKWLLEKRKGNPSAPERGPGLAPGSAYGLDNDAVEPPKFLQK